MKTYAIEFMGDVNKLFVNFSFEDFNLFFNNLNLILKINKVL